MNIGTTISLMETEIYNFAVNIFQNNRIPPELGINVMNCVCKRFAESAYLAAAQEVNALTANLEKIEAERKKTDGSRGQNKAMTMPAQKNPTLKEEKSNGDTAEKR